MSREPKRMEDNIRGSSKILVYIIAAIVIVTVIISYAIIANIIGNRKEAERLAEIENSEKQKEEIANIEIGTTEDEENAESVSTQMGTTVEESEKKNEEEEEKTSSISTSTPNENITIPNNENSTNSENISNEENIVEEPKKEITFAMPVEGEIVRGYAQDSLVYSETLQEWIVHQAIDIKANSRDVVKAAAEGTVTAIKNDPRYGLTVIIEHEGGFKTVYSNLLTAEFVVEGEKVKQGQTLGTVGSSATFEIADEPHLHFEMLKDSQYVDPTIYMK